MEFIHLTFLRRESYDPRKDITYKKVHCLFNPLAISTVIEGEDGCTVQTLEPIDIAEGACGSYHVAEGFDEIQRMLDRAMEAS